MPSDSPSRPLNASASRLPWSETETSFIELQTTDAVSQKPEVISTFNYREEILNSTAVPMSIKVLPFNYFYKALLVSFEKLLNSNYLYPFRFYFFTLYVYIYRHYTCIYVYYTYIYRKLCDWSKIRCHVFHGYILFMSSECRQVVLEIRSVCSMRSALQPKRVDRF